ncbi:MAG TPA: MMPL family transporter [Candidatus Nanoarchaeia archaeon]|nr:MMPL family transporter [Candidatus Nanoarchaeia archaeon]
MSSPAPGHPAPSGTPLYKKLIIIPFVIFALAVAVLVVQQVRTGEIIHKGIDIKGGVSVTIPLEQAVDSIALQGQLSQAFPGSEFTVRSLTQTGQSTGVIVSADMDIADQQQVDSLISTLSSLLEIPLEPGQYTLEGVGSALGRSFFRGMIVSVLVSLVLMSLVVFLYFRNAVSSTYVVLSVIFDIIITLAIVNLLGMKLGAAGIAAFLMLIGYSVDTDILLTTRVTRRKEGSIADRVREAMITGMTMTATTLVALVLGMLLTDSEVIRQIMTILFIGLMVDVLTTWMQNAGLIRMHMEKKYHG